LFHLPSFVFQKEELAPRGTQAPGWKSSRKAVCKKIASGESRAWEGRSLFAGPKRLALLFEELQPGQRQGVGYRLGLA